jgi:hypothetical protein
VEHHTVLVEADADKVDPLRPDPACQSLDTVSLAGPDGVDRVIPAGHGSHLNGNLYPMIEGKQIDLPILDDHVSGKDLNPVTLENASCKFFAEGTNL